MEIQDLRAIRGPNVFHHKPVLIMTLQLFELNDRASNEIKGFNENLERLLPGLREHHCSPGRPGGFLERLRRGTYMAHIVEHIALELSRLAGIEVGYGKSVHAGREGVYNVVVRCRSEEGMTFLLRTAVEIAEACIHAHGDFPVQSKIEEAKRIIAEAELGPSTRAIVAAAERRGIPWTRLNEMSLIQFGYGKNRKLIQATTTGQTSDIAVDIAQDKDLTKRMLDNAAIRVPRGVVAHDEQEALRAFEELGGPVAIKPLDGHHGQGVSLNLATALEVAAAYGIAAQFSKAVLVEEYLTGRDYRVLVVNGRMIAASERIPAHVLGDGKSSISELIEIENRNPLRGEGHEKPMTKIHVDAATLAYLAKVGLSMSAVPKAGECVFLKETANISTGGIAVDVTDQVHPEVRLLCERAARVVGLDVCGVDLIAKDIAKPIGRDIGVVEVNAGPGIRMHVHPARGKSRDVGSAILEALYPPGHDGRIPIVAITGTNGKTTVTRLTSFIFSRAGRTTGTTTTDGIYIDGVRVASGDTTGPISARTILSDPDVEVAVLETARGGLVKRGLGFDWCDVGVMTNISADHIGQDGIESLDDIVHIKSLVAERVRVGGTLILNADDPHLVRLGERLRQRYPGRHHVYFGLDPRGETLRRHCAAGGRAFFHQSGWIVEARGNEERKLIHASEIPLTLMGTAMFQVANVLAALAATVASGIPYEVILPALRQFKPIENNSGRANLFRVGAGYAMLDYGHNPDAFKAVCEMTARWNARRVTGVIGVPGDRSDDVVREAAQAAVRGFDRVVIRDDIDLRGRAAGEAPELLRSVIAERAPEIECKVILNEFEAMRSSLATIGEREIVVIFYDDLNVATHILQEFGAQPLEGFEALRLFSVETIHPNEPKDGNTMWTLPHAAPVSH